MEQFVNNKRVPVGYLPIYREYYVRDCQSKVVIYTIEYCPWCGKKLPLSLRDEYFAILESEYEIDNDIRAREAGILPAEFETDEWWKKRGL